MAKKLLLFVTTTVLFLFPGITYSQAPQLGSAASFVLFSSNGAVSNVGLSHITGNVGANIGAVTGFGNVNGVMHTSDAASALCAADLLIAYNQLNSRVPTAFLSPLLGNGQTLNAGVYSIAVAAALNGTLILDAQGNANAVFIFQIQAALSASVASHVVLINGAQACNVFWKVEGLVSIAAASTMEGTFIANNAALNMGAGVRLEGRVFSTTGAVTVNAVSAATPPGCGSPLLTGPVAPVLRSTACYALFSASGDVTNSGITSIRGDVGTNTGVTSGYDPLKVNGTIHLIPDGSTGTCATDLLTVYNYLNALPYDIQLLFPAQFGNSLSLTPHTYLLNTAAVLTDTLFLDAQDNASAVFVIKINGAFSTSLNATVVLLNGAQAGNVFWDVTGAVSINTSSHIAGTMVNNGAINLNPDVVLNGRAFTTSGMVTTNAATVTMPPGCNATHSVYTWIGGSGDWNTASNWNTTSNIAIPSGCAADVIIPAGSPSISTAVRAANVSISSSVQLSIAGSLSVCGNIIGGNGAPAIISGTGKVILAGNDAQSVSGNTTFSNLELNNTAGAAIINGSTVSITGTYLPTSGTLASNGGLVLQSSVNGTSLIATGSGNYITGSVTIERYIPARRAWRLLSAPINTTQTINAAWQEGATSSTDNPYPGYGTHITGGTIANGFDQSPTNNPNIKYYNNKWIGVSNTNATSMTQYPGYFLFVRGNRSYDIIHTTVYTPPSITTLRVKGEINQGINTVTYTNLPADQFVVVGNPYAAPVDFTTIGKTNIKNTFWAWDAQRSGTSLGGYVTVSRDEVTGTYDIDFPPSQTAQTQIIQSGQAIFVQVLNSNAITAITFTETDKAATDITNNVFREGGDDPSQRIQIILNRDTGSAWVPIDGVLAKFAAGYSKVGNDNAMKLYNFDENLSLKRNGLNVSIERRGAIAKNDTLFLNIDSLTANSNYSFEFSVHNFKNEPFSAYLVDNYLGSKTPVSLADSSLVSFHVDSTLLSADSSRFMVVFSPSTLLPVGFTNLTASQAGQDVQVEWTVQSETNVQKYTVERSADRLLFTDLISVAARNSNKVETYSQLDKNPFDGTNFYRIKTSENTGRFSYSKIVKVDVSRGAPSFSIYPNPVTNNKVSAQLMNLRAGEYSLKMYDLNGHQLMIKKITFNDNNSVYPVSLPAGIASGTYYFLLKNGANNSAIYKQYIMVQ